MICILALSKVSRLYLVSVAERTGLNLTCSKIPEDTFSRDVAHIWAWWSSWPCDQARLNKLPFANPMEDPYEIWLQSA